MDKEFWKEELSEMNEHIMNDCTVTIDYRKGLIAHDEWIDFVKENLKYDELKAVGKVAELTIDESWANILRETEDNDGRNVKDFWNKLVVAAYQANHGLLVLNISNIEVFKHCWHLKQLAKQENDMKYWGEKPFDFYSKQELLDWREEMIRETGKELYAEQLMELIDGFKFDGYVLLNIGELNWEDVSDYANEHNPGEFDAMKGFYTRVRIEE